MTHDAIRVAEIQSMRTRLWESTANCKVRADFEALLERLGEKDTEIARLNAVVRAPGEPENAGRRGMGR